ncbi:MAG TPA: RHS repeat-associated core domain-containing protein, partial [Tepidisphaeraceae bacterium]|nr:RHS repeat-associated core domain-containing protein [Tepidisphaeraceae bacterium]
TVLDPAGGADADGLSDFAWSYLHQGGRRDSSTGLYHFRHRDYDPALGRWLQQDPLRYVDGMNVYEFVSANPITLTDPTGLTPNQKDAVDVGWLIRRIQDVERKNVNASPCDILNMVQDFFDGATKYIYTDSAKWIDLNHFFTSAGWADDVGSTVTYGFGVLTEVAQLIFGHVTLWEDGIASSAFNSEDIPSNNLGIQFTWKLRCCAGAPSLSSQLQSFLEKAGPRRPEDAPDWNVLPRNEREHEDAHWDELNGTLDGFLDILNPFDPWTSDLPAF